MTFQVSESVARKDRDNSSTFAHCLEVSKRVGWDIDRDVIRGRVLDFTHKFLPDGLSLVPSIGFLAPEEKVRLSQVQGRTYAMMFGLVERFISAKVLEITEEYWLDDQIALEALVRFCNEELKHQELFRRIEALAAAEMSPGYRFPTDPNVLARVVLSKSPWAVMALILHIELFTLLHYQESIADDDQLSPLFRDVFLFHWKEESQHAIMDEIEWRKLDARITDEQRRQGVCDLIELFQALDGILKVQADNDCQFFCSTFLSPCDLSQAQVIETNLLEAYRWQYIHSGARQRKFVKVLEDLVKDEELMLMITGAIDALN